MFVTVYYFLFVSVYLFTVCNVRYVLVYIVHRKHVCVCMCEWRYMVYKCLN